MSNLLAAALSLGAIRLYLAFRVSPGNSRWWYFGFGSAVYLLALFAKATAVVAPLMAAILDLGFLRSSPRRVVISLFPWLAAAGIFGWIAHLSQRAPGTPLMDRPTVAIDALAFYFGKLFWPFGLTVDYGRTPSRVLMGHFWRGNLAVLFILGIIFFLLWRNYRGMAVGAIVMLAGLLPVLGLVPFGFQEYSTVADHFLYLGMLGPSLAGGVILAGTPGRWALPLAAGLGLGLAVLSAEQLRVWRNSGTLVARALAIDPGSAVGNEIVGSQLDRVGKPAAAVPYFSAAIARDPTNPEFHYNLANAWLRMGEYEKSIEEFQAALPLFHPPSWKAMNNLGVAYVKAGRLDQAMIEFRQVLDVDPENAEAAENIRMLEPAVLPLDRLGTGRARR
jgi:Flp pilus assembly protein TadD